MPMRPVDVTVSIARPVFASTGKLRCECKIVYSGGRMALPKVVFGTKPVSALPVLVDLGTETCLVMALQVPTCDAGA